MHNAQCTVSEKKMYNIICKHIWYDFYPEYLPAAAMYIIPGILVATADSYKFHVL